MSLFQKFPGNPVLTAAAFPDDIMYVSNPGAVKFRGEYLLMLDAATAATPIVFWLARSGDGIHFTPDPAPVEWPGFSDGLPETCVYDPRITEIGGEYLILYASMRPGLGVRPGMVRTRDFVRFERVEQAETGQDNRNTVLFPEKIAGRYVRFDRPMSGECEPADICISYSDDLVHWNDSQILMAPRPGCWDSHKIGGGAVPIRTDEGWLAIYHGVDHSSCNGYIYRLGVMLLDLENPARVIARGGLPVLWPEQPYEILGRTPNVTFACNAIPEPDGSVKLFYGAADTCIGLATARLDALVAACKTGNPTAERFFHNKARNE